MIPDVPELRKTLNEIFLDEIDGDKIPDGAIRVCGPPDAITKQSVDWNNTTVVLRLGGKTKIGLVRFLETMRAGMEAAGHAHCSRSSPVANTLSAIVTAFAVQTGFRFDLLTAMKESVGDWTLSTWALLPGTVNSDRHYSFGEFKYGLLDFDRLEEVCRQIGTDAFNRVRIERGKTWRSTGAVSREAIPVRAITFNQVPKKLIPAGKASPLMDRVVEEYFQMLFEGEKTRFLQELDRQQTALVISGNGSIPSATFNALGNTINWVACFSPPMSGHGWGLSQFALMKFSKPSAERLEDCKIRIEADLQIHDWMTRTIDPKLQVFSEYFFAAEEMSDRGRIDEATLHLVFALDLLLGGKAGDALTKVLASRVAMLSHFALDIKFEEQRKFIEESYDLRSGYVHRGLKFELSMLSTKSGESMVNRFERLTQTSRVLFAAGCFARQQSWCSGSDAHDKWISRIDLLCQTQFTGKPLRDDDLDELGIHRIRSRKENAKATLVSIDWSGPQKPAD